MGETDQPLQLYSTTPKSSHPMRMVNLKKKKCPTPISYHGRKAIIAKKKKSNLFYNYILYCYNFIPLKLSSFFSVNGQPYPNFSDLDPVKLHRVWCNCTPLTSIFTIQLYHTYSHQFLSILFFNFFLNFFI